MRRGDIDFDRAATASRRKQFGKARGGPGMRHQTGDRQPLALVDQSVRVPSKEARNGMECSLSIEPGADVEDDDPIGGTAIVSRWGPTPFRGSRNDIRAARSDDGIGGRLGLNEGRAQGNGEDSQELFF